MSRIVDADAQLKAEITYDEMVAADPVGNTAYAQLRDQGIQDMAVEFAKDHEAGQPIDLSTARSIGAGARPETDGGAARRRSWGEAAEKRGEML